MPIMVSEAFLCENQKFSDKMLPPVGIEPWPHWIFFCFHAVKPLIFKLDGINPFDIVKLLQNIIYFLFETVSVKG